MPKTTVTFITRGGIVRSNSSLKKRANNVPELPMETTYGILRVKGLERVDPAIKLV